MKTGDMIWMSRPPGGWCLVIEEVEDATSDWERYLIVWHSEEGLICDPTYYFDTCEEALVAAQRAM